MDRSTEDDGFEPKFQEVFLGSGYSNRASPPFEMRLLMTRDIELGLGRLETVYNILKERQCSSLQWGDAGSMGPGVDHELDLMVSSIHLENSQSLV